ncbi:hypothetical protein K502DRAFT_346270 [Neoconidiobolus thromboides FSU 785]|nr:hypothetical protein K502DRAFT_346270 [Neoconidiobolus thromboides FSU 785]
MSKSFGIFSSIANLIVDIVLTTSIAETRVPNYDYGHDIKFDVYVPFYLIVNLMLCGVINIIITGTVTVITFIIALRHKGTGSPYMPINGNGISNNSPEPVLPYHQVKIDEKNILAIAKEVDIKIISN